MADPVVPRYGRLRRLDAGPPRPDAVITTNGPYFKANLNGQMFEGWPARTWDLATWKEVILAGRRRIQPTTRTHGECDGSQSLHHRRARRRDYAGTGGTQNFTAVNWQYMRYTLCTTLLNDGFYLYEDDASGYGNSLWWFDEYDNAGQGRGYLGQPRGAGYSVGSNVWRRDYDGGIALVNPDTVAHTVTLGGTFRKINGTQARAVNNGSLVTAVTLQPRDGIVLLSPTTSKVTAPVFKRKSKNHSGTAYSISGSVQIGSAGTVQSASHATAAARTPVVLEVRVERYVRKHWRAYKKVRVVNPRSRYTTRIRLRSGKYRARTVVTGGSVASASSRRTRNFKVR